MNRHSAVILFLFWIVLVGLYLEPTQTDRQTNPVQLLIMKLAAQTLAWWKGLILQIGTWWTVLFIIFWLVQLLAQKLERIARFLHLLLMQLLAQNCEHVMSIIDTTCSVCLTNVSFKQAITHCKEAFHTHFSVSFMQTLSQTVGAKGIPLHRKRDKYVWTTCMDGLTDRQFCSKFLHVNTSHPVFCIPGERIEGL